MKLKTFVRHNICGPILSMLPPKMHLSIWYRWAHGRWPNWNNPIDFAEKIMVKMFSPEWNRYSVYVDKIAVRDYVKSKGLDSILPMLYCVHTDAKDIDFDKLPQSFAIKTNNGCGGHIFCRDKALLDKESVIKKINSILRKEYHVSVEAQYTNIPPMVYCEELLDDKTGVLPTDYKFQCIHGEPVYVFVGTERDNKVRYSTFDMNWNELDYIKPSYKPTRMPLRPKNLAMMVEIARTLSSDFDTVRVDLYDLQDRILFGELTFSPGSGVMEFFTREGLDITGKMLNLNK